MSGGWKFDNLDNMEKTYDPKKYEDKILQKWEKSGYFNPDNLNVAKDAKSYTIVLPPPNVTDKLHMGHASTLAIEDLLIRYHRLQGERTLWIPGTDHAAIATQNVVEKKLYKETGQTRHDLGREKFLEKVHSFAKETQATILEQIRRMGASLDWSRLAFTLDDSKQKAVKKMFVDMYEQGAIYRGERVVNWCPRCHSTLADDEVEHKQQTAKLYTFKYNKGFPFAISTTRPETKIGDTAVAVNPKDKRYKKYVGQTFKVNFVGVDLNIKVIMDNHIDMDFGTGVLGVTPAHALIDWQMAQKEGLEMIKVIDENGNIREGFGDYSGKTGLEARKMIVAKLEDAGLMESVEDIENNLSVCYRCNSSIEPLPSKQWFVSVDEKLDRLDKKSFKEKALEVVDKQEIKFIPERFEKRYRDWMENLHDWCISRQIWFGHRIPVWYKNIPGKEWNNKISGGDIFDSLRDGSKIIETRVGRAKGSGKDWANLKPGDIMNFVLVDDETEELLSPEKISRKIKQTWHFDTIDEMFVRLDINKIAPGRTIEEYRQTVEADFKDRLGKYGVWAFELEEVRAEEIYVGEIEPTGEGWIQDEDTLDTWFSSGMWTFSTLGWPEQTEDLKNFHPTQVLETGYEIITLWVSRMIMMSLFALKEIPFETVYLHGMVLDSKGKKMSKSKGNGIDPLDVIDKFGTDSSRLSLLIGNTPGNDLKLDEDKIASYRNFVNKLWNISRYVITVVGKDNLVELDYNKFTFTDKWIYSTFDTLIIEVTDDLDNHRFSTAGEKLRNFTWNDLADWYLEMSKFEKDGQKKEILNYLLKNLLKLWHPFMPFVTESIHQELDPSDLLMVEQWPKKKLIDQAQINDFDNAQHIVDKVRGIIQKIREARSDNKVEPAKKIKAVIHAHKYCEELKDQGILIKRLRTGVEELEILEKGLEPKYDIKFSFGKEIEIYLIGAVDKEKEEARRAKEKIRLEKLIIGVKGRLDNKEFADKAPKHIVQIEKDKLADWETERKKLG